MRHVTRLATFDDVPDGTAIFNQSIEDRAAVFETRLRPRDEVRQWIGRPHPLVVVTGADAVVAFAAATTYREGEC